MNPQFEQSSGLRLPEPSQESALASDALEKTTGREKSPPGPESTSPPPSINAPPPGAYVPPPIPEPPVAPTPVQPAVDIPAPADDSDDPALDEEWINRAKEIVERTRTDPYLQSRELSKFKADYLQVRHNKTIKVIEDRRQ